MLVVPVEKKIDWKRPPVTLIVLVLIYFIVFAFYQSTDHKHAQSAVETFLATDLVDLEWKAFQAYSRDKKLNYELDKRNPEVISRMATDDDFARFVKENLRYYINSKHSEKWRLARESVNIHAQQISFNAFALNSQNITILQLFSHQFLHADAMHLFGNMVFLILTGFAVEAAIGSLRFAGFTLLSGVGGGLLFSMLAGPSGGSLVGASGAISGVMAMYVMLFGTRKIQFFYYFFIFTGYFRAAAIVMLPLYILHEIYQFYSNTGSNVAYMAHTGGFLVGAAMIYLTQAVNHNAIDEGYIDNKKEAEDPLAVSIQKIYNVMAQCDFSNALKTLKPLKLKHPNNPALVELEHNLVRAVHPSKYDQYLVHRMDKTGNSKALVHAQLEYWENLSHDKKMKLSFAKKQQLIMNALGEDAFNTAEDIYNSVKSLRGQDQQLASLAQHLSQYFKANANNEKSSDYSSQAMHFATREIAPLGGLNEM